MARGGLQFALEAVHVGAKKFNSQFQRHWLSVWNYFVSCPCADNVGVTVTAAGVQSLL